MKINNHIPFGKPMISNLEKNAVQKILSGNILVHGPKSKEFEHIFCKFTKSPHAVSVSSCTAGLHLIYFTLGLIYQFLLYVSLSQKQLKISL